MRKKFKDNPVVDIQVEATGDLEELQVKRRDQDGTWDGRIPEENFIAEYSEADLLDVMNQQQRMIEILKSHGFSRHTANRLLVVFDDLVGSSLFNNARQNPFKKLNTTHRHFSASLIEISQAYKEIPKTVRTNWTCLILFEIFSEGELNAIMEEYPFGIRDKKHWMELYQHAVEGDHNFLFYDVSKPKRLRLMKNFDRYLFFKEENKPKQEGLLKPSKQQL